MAPKLSNITAGIGQPFPVSLSFYADQAQTEPLSLTGFTVEVRLEPQFDPAILLTDGSGLTVNYGAGTLTFALPASAFQNLGDGIWRVRLLNVNGEEAYSGVATLAVRSTGNVTTTVSVVAAPGPSGAAAQPILSYSRSGAGETAAVAAIRQALSPLGLIRDSTTA